MTQNTILSNSNGLLLASALQEQPSLTLRFYSYGIMMEKRTNNIVQEYPVDPEQLSLAVSAKFTFHTGLLNPNTLLVAVDGVKKTVVEYRPPQKTGIYLEGSDKPLRIPLPGMVMIRITTEHKHPDYHVFAVKNRPETLDVPLFNLPLPNTSSNGSVCWGTVRRPETEELKSNSLESDWRQLLGSPFGDHTCHQKSKAHMDDVRKQLIDIEKRNARRYPIRDLVPLKITLKTVLEKHT